MLREIWKLSQNMSQQNGLDYWTITYKSGITKQIVTGLFNKKALLGNVSKTQHNTSKCLTSCFFFYILLVMCVKFSESFNPKLWP